MEKILNYFNPLARLGIKRYSTLFPLLSAVALASLLEFLSFVVFKDPNASGLAAIVLFVGLIIYFSFRDGIKGGVIATLVTISYYAYIIYTRHHQGDQLRASIQTVIGLAIIYLILALVIGWLKQTIDTLMETEMEARRLAEEGQMRLETILEQLPVGVLLVDLKHKLIQGNKQVEKVLGQKIKIPLTADDTYENVHAYQEDKPMAAKEWPLLRALKRGENIVGEEIKYLRDDNKELHLRVNAAPIRNRKKEIIAAVSTFYDVTQEKELEKRKDDFINMASHELKTPLTSMKLYLDSLFNRVNKSEDEKAIKTLNSIKNQTLRLQELVNDLLDVSRIQTGKLHFHKEEFRLDQLVIETVEMLQDTTPQAILIVKKTPIKIMADRFRIYQVITNLITNAIKYSSKNADIKIRIQRQKGAAVVSVQDFGIGIAKSQRKMIFERLYQVTDATEKTFPGLGMGLYISKEIVKRHKGKIWVEGEKGKGSIFYFSLPLIPPSRAVKKK